MQCRFYSKYTVFSLQLLLAKYFQLSSVYSIFTYVKPSASLQLGLLAAPSSRSEDRMAGRTDGVWRVRSSQVHFMVHLAVLCIWQFRCHNKCSHNSSQSSGHFETDITHEAHFSLHPASEQLQAFLFKVTAWPIRQLTNYHRIKRRVKYISWLSTGAKFKVFD